MEVGLLSAPLLQLIELSMVARMDRMDLKDVLVVGHEAAEQLRVVAVAESAAEVAGVVREVAVLWLGL